ncbi:phosphoketolase family protein [Candidatus Peregrinibacteria bacterium]|nr:phosphoketolase family protein [Candidatus Peregrinibacteria bacterium]
MLSQKQALQSIKKYLRLADYLGVAQLYLKDNFLLRESLKPEHIKDRVLGHWGTVPGLNLIYANLNYLVKKHDTEVLMIAGPGHGAPAILANLFLEGTLHEFYKPRFEVNAKGMGEIIKDFSWPHTKFPSHVTPAVPGSILEGGELGYSLSTAFGAAFDNPNLIVAVAVGDGESETGPLATAWHSNKFLNPKTSGAVLPIVHINGYKISNPTIYGTMSDEELTRLFLGYGYEPMIVNEPNLEKKMMETMEKAYMSIKKIQKMARSGKNIMKPRFPVILLRSPKGWKGIHAFAGHLIEGSFHAHGVPIEDPKKNPKALKAIENWLRSYHIEELINENGKPKKDIMECVPMGALRIGMNKHAIGGTLLKELKLPDLKKYAVKLNQGILRKTNNEKMRKKTLNDGEGVSEYSEKRGRVFASSMEQGAEILKSIFTLNPENFRIMCPDEIESNKLGKIFEATKRGYMWPIKKTDENIAPEGRVMEMLSEHTLQGWLQGYVLTGRHGIFVSYEAFTTIITSMVDQYAKFLKQSFHVNWRKPLASAVYLLSSVGWRQEHNGYSHQNPGFISNILQKHGEFCQLYFPPDANSLLMAFEETLKRRDAICVIVAEKRKLPQWLTLEEAREQAKKGIGIWEWATGKEASKNPDVVLASAGDNMTEEAMSAVKICHELVPEIKIRYVNISELTSLCVGDFCPRKTSCTTEREMHQYFTKDKPVVFAYHGYKNDIEHILWDYGTSRRFSIHGYEEKGSTTTPFDLKILNGVSCYHLALDIIEQAAKTKKISIKKRDALKKSILRKIEEHHQYICKHGDDPEEIKNTRW